MSWHRWHLERATQSFLIFCFVHWIVHLLWHKRNGQLAKSSRFIPVMRMQIEGMCYPPKAAQSWTGVSEMNAPGRTTLALFQTLLYLRLMSAAWFSILPMPGLSSLTTWMPMKQWTVLGCSPSPRLRPKMPCCLSTTLRNELMRIWEACWIPARVDSLPVRMNRRFLHGPPRTASAADPPAAKCASYQKGHILRLGSFPTSSTLPSLSHCRSLSEIRILVVFGLKHPVSCLQWPVATAYGNWLIAVLRCSKLRRYISLPASIPPLPFHRSTPKICLLASKFCSNVFLKLSGMESGLTVWALGYHVGVIDGLFSFCMPVVHRCFCIDWRQAFPERKGLAAAS